MPSQILPEGSSTSREIKISLTEEQARPLQTCADIFSPVVDTLDDNYTEVSLLLDAFIQFILGYHVSGKPRFFCES